MLVHNKTATCIEGFQYYFAQIVTIVQWSVGRTIQVQEVKVKITYRDRSSNRNMTKCIGIITQIVIIMTTYVSLVRLVNICKGKVTEDEEISRFCPEHIFYMLGRIVMKHHRNVHFYEKL
jgi:hypothetical protein